MDKTKLYSELYTHFHKYGLQPMRKTTHLFWSAIVLPTKTVDPPQKISIFDLF
jgi:hypothetical protein